MSQPERKTLVVKRWILALTALSAAAVLVVVRWPAAAPPATVATIEPASAAAVVVLSPGPEAPTPVVVSPAPREQTPRPEELAGDDESAKRTALELMEQYVDEICACPDMACFDEARDHHNRHVGRPTGARDHRNDLALHDAFTRASACLEELRRDSSGG